jgi:hypothetical protein
MACEHGEYTFVVDNYVKIFLVGMLSDLLECVSVYIALTRITSGIVGLSRASGASTRPRARRQQSIGAGAAYIVVCKSLNHCE